MDWIARMMLGVVAKPNRQFWQSSMMAIEYGID